MCFISGLSTGENSRSCTLGDNCRLGIIFGDIVEQRADVIVVCPVGGVSSLTKFWNKILHVGGKLTPLANIGGPLTAPDIADRQGGLVAVLAAEGAPADVLPCRYIISAKVPPLPPNGSQNDPQEVREQLREVCHNCLEMASLLKGKSIALPAIFRSGNVDSPRVSARGMLDAIWRFCWSQEDSSVQHIKIVSFSGPDISELFGCLDKMG